VYTLGAVGSRLCSARGAVVDFLSEPGFEPTTLGYLGFQVLPDKGSSDNILEMSSNVELHSQSCRSSMTFGPIASKCFNISSQSKRAILNIFLTFVTFDQPEYRGMSTARFRVSPLSIKLPNRAEGVRKSDIIFGGVSEVKKVQD